MGQARSVRRCAVLGSPVTHSLSPALHTAAYAHLGLEWVYERHEVDAAGLAAFIDGLDQTWRGLSLTMPLKEAALSCVDEVSDVARSARAINTVLLDDGGHRFGDNTDVPGLVSALSERGVQRVAEMAVLGGGATARSAVAAARQVADAVTVYVRTSARGDEVGATADAFGLRCTIRPWTQRREALSSPLVVSTVPAGAGDDLAALVPPAVGALLDVVYDPWPTELARAWAAAGGTVASGLDLLVHQAVLQVQLWAGVAVPVDVLRAAGEAALGASLRRRSERVDGAM